jgi:hypothetical protein
MWLIKSPGAGMIEPAFSSFFAVAKRRRLQQDPDKDNENVYMDGEHCGRRHARAQCPMYWAQPSTARTKASAL